MPDGATVFDAVLSAAGEDTADARVFARRVCQACVTNLDIDGAAISLATAAVSRETLWATDEVAELLEDLQFSLGEGACVHAARTRAAVLVPDLHHSTRTDRWPVFAGAVAEQTDVRALFALPLQWGTTNIGALDLYRRAPGPLTNAELADLTTAVDLVAMMLVGILTNPAVQEKLDDPASRRSEVHVAIGVLMAELKSSATDALARMRAHAFSHRLLLDDVAHDIVDRRLHLPPTTA